MTVNRCDNCNKIFKIDSLTITDHLWNRYEFCNKCAKPILAALIGQQLVSETIQQKLQAKKRIFTR